MKINELFETDEIVWGGAIGFGFCFIVGWWALLMGIFTAVLTRLGGMGLWGTKAWRRIGVPTAVLIFLSIKTGFTFWLIIPCAISALLLSLGYGTKSPNDEGSPFGNWCMKVTGSELGAHIMTRSIIVLGILASWYITCGLTR